MLLKQTATHKEEKYPNSHSKLINGIKHGPLANKFTLNVVCLIGAHDHLHNNSICLFEL